MHYFLKEIREGRGMTISELSRESGVSRQTISYIEGGKRGTSLEVLAKLAKALKVDVKDLIALEV